MQYWQLCQLRCARNPEHSRSLPKSSKGFVSSRISSLRMFHWTRRMPYWRTLSFLQNRFSSEQPSKDIRLYLPPSKVLPKSSSGHVDFVFDTLVENFCLKSGISSFKSRKECQTYFFGKKTLLSQSFSLLNIWNAVLTTPLKTFREQNIIFPLNGHKSKNSGDCQVFSPGNVRLRRTRRMPAWFVQFLFWSFCGRGVCGLDNAGGSVFKGYWNFSLKSGEVLKVQFFWKKVQFIPKVALVTWNAVLATLPTLLCQKTKTFSLTAQKLERFCFFQNFVP